jgi:flagellar protein FlgJ
MTNQILPSGFPAAPAGAAANTYSDLSGMSALKNAPRSPAALHAVAQQVDALFLQMMLKSMRDASADNAETPSNELGMYQDMFDKQISLSLSQHQDMGLGSAILRQLGGTPSGAKGTTAAPAAGAGAHGHAVPQSTAARAPSALEGPVADGAASAMDAESSGSGARGASVPSNFVSAVLPVIQVAAGALGVSPLGMLAQAALETGWGQRMPKTASGASSLNLFGIKADDAWEGPKATATTLEISGGVAKPKRAAFRVYGSIAQSVGDFANLIGSSPRYRAAVADGANPHAYVAGIGKSGYASDPAYAAKLAKLMNSRTFRDAVAASGIVL